LFLLRLFLVLSTLFLSLKAEYIVELHNSQNVYSIDRGVLYLEDKSSNLRIDDVSLDTTTFEIMQKNDLNFGFTSSAYWFKITLLDHSTISTRQWWLDIEYTLLDDIQIYQKVGDRYTLLLHSGDEENFSKRFIQWRTYSTILNTKEPSTLYIRVKTQSAMQVPIKIYSSEEIVKIKQGETLFFGFFYGVLILIIFYNIFSFFVWNDKNYLYYVAFISSFMLWQLCLDGLGHQYLWPDIVWLSEKGVLVFISMTIFSAILFTRSFLHLREYAFRLNYLLMALQSIMLLIAISSFLLPYAFVIQVLVWLVFPIPLILLYAGVMALRNKYQYARFYIIGWSLFLGGSVLLALNTLGFIGGYEYIKYVQQVGSLAEVIFFSLALAERINLLRQQNIKTLSRLNTRLQSEVHEKVAEIREKDELLMQKFRLATMGEMLENISHQWKQPLHKLSLVIQNYYFKHKLEGASLDELEKFNEQSSVLVAYMSSTIDDFRNFFNPQKEKEYFDLRENIEGVIEMLSSSMREEKIDINIGVSYGTKINGYANEFGQVLLNLFSNAKDAFVMNDIEGRQLKISIHETQEALIMKFRDNAGGIDTSILEKIFDPYFSTKGFKEGAGIGLYMSKMIIENSMHGKLSVENTNNGAEFTIMLPKVL